jgi:hypothetical protein
VAVSEITRDWQPTWRINAVTDAWVMEHEKDDIPSNFVLRIEENRTVRDIGGGEVMEIRWRPPTKGEVREIVRRYHKAVKFQTPAHRSANERATTNPYGITLNRAWTLADALEGLRLLHSIDNDEG